MVEHFRFSCLEVYFYINKASLVIWAPGFGCKYVWDPIAQAGSCFWHTLNISFWNNYIGYRLVKFNYSSSRYTCRGVWLDISRHDHVCYCKSLHQLHQYLLQTMFFCQVPLKVALLGFLVGVCVYVRMRIKYLYVHIHSLSINIKCISLETL